MIINEINLAHVQQDKRNQYYLNEVLEAILIQREEAYREALQVSKAMPKWLSIVEIKQLTSVYDEKQKAVTEQLKNRKLIQEKEQNKMLNVELTTHTMPLFTSQIAINKVMTVSELKTFIEAQKQTLGVYDIEQAQAVLYQIALHKNKQVRVFNHV